MDELQSRNRRLDVLNLVGVHAPGETTMKQSERLTDIIIGMLIDPESVLSDKPFSSQSDFQSIFDISVSIADSKAHRENAPVTWIREFSTQLEKRWPGPKAPDIKQFKPPFRVGSQTTTTVFDAKSAVVVKFPVGQSTMARDYVKFLNLNT